MKKTIITDIKFLKQKSLSVGFWESKRIIKNLEDTLKTTKNGIGLTGIQIGIPKRVSIIRLPNFKLNLINNKIIEQSDLIRFPESCLSLPGLKIDTQRYNYVKLDNGKLYKGLVAVCIQHELNHQEGKLIIDKGIKWRKRR